MLIIADWKNYGTADISEINNTDEAFCFCENKEAPSLWQVYALHLIHWMQTIDAFQIQTAKCTKSKV